MAEQTAVAPRAAARGPLWRFDRTWFRRLLMIWPVVVLAVQILHRRLLPHPLMLIESAVYVALFTALLSFVPIRDFLTAIPTPHRWVIGGFFLCLTIGQLTLDNRRTFPFPTWMMYGRPESRDMVEYFRYRGITTSGQEAWINPWTVFPFVNSAEIASRVKGFGRQLMAKNPERRDAALSKVRDWVTAIGTAYNDDHPDAALRSLEFVRYRWDYRGGQPRSDVQPEAILSVDFPERSAR